MNLLSRFLLLVVSLLYCVSYAWAAKEQDNAPVSVIVAVMQPMSISDRIEAQATARANESVKLTANVSEKVREIHFSDTQRVNAGDTLVVLEQAEEQATLQQARAQLHERKLALQRAVSLEKQKLTATDALDRARLAVEESEATIRAIQARIDDRVIRAPFSGVVGLRQLSLGTLVEPGQLITTLDDTTQIKLDFSIPARFISELKPGMKIVAATALSAPDGSQSGSNVHHGEVSSIDSRVDPVSRTVQLRAILPNAEGRIVPGMLLQVGLLYNTREGLMIPEAALLPQGDKQFVMVLEMRDGTPIAKRQLIKTGLRQPGKVEVVSGLSLQDQVVTHGNNKIKPGKPLKVLAVDDGTQDLSDLIKGKTIKGSQP